MMSYRFSRRSFLASTGAAAGLHALLRNVEAQAQGAPRPRRLLVTHHPCGTMRYAWTPTGSGTTYTTSRILQPFEDAGLRPNMVVVDGLNMDTVGGVGGGIEAGTVMMVTGTPTKGTRNGDGNGTVDTMAAGPSFDQLVVLLRPELARAFSSLSALCDDREDNIEIAPICLSYSATTRPAAPGLWTTADAPYENIANRATLRPFDLYTRIFGSMMPGGTVGTNPTTLAKARIAKKSVLDLSLRELARLRALAPSSQKALLDAHEAAIRQLEQELDASGGAQCVVPPAPSISLGSTVNTYDAGTTLAPDNDRHRFVGEAHLAILRAAFMCDLARVAVFQWASGTSHVAFGGLYPQQPDLVLPHYATLSAIVNATEIVPTNPVAEFGVNVEIWYNTRLATFLQTLKSTVDFNDPAGGTLLDNTVVPYLTEVANVTRIHSPMPLTLFGGHNLGIQGGQYLTFPGRPYNDLWLTILQSLGISLADLQGAVVNGHIGAPMLSAPHTGPLEGVLA